MHNSILLQTLRKLQPKELRGVRNAAGNPLWNTRPEVIHLADYIVQVLLNPRPQLKALDKEHAWAAVFPDQTYSEKTLRYLLSWLLDVVRRYLAALELEKDPVAEQILLCRALRTRDLDDQFDKTQRETESLQDQSPRRDAQYLYHRYLLRQEYTEQCTRTRRIEGIDFQPLTDDLTGFYAAEILRHACSSRMHETMARRSYQFVLLQAVLDAAEAGHFANYPAVYIFYHAYRTQEGLEDHFQALKEQLNSSSDLLSQEDMRGLYLLAINFCIKKMNADNAAFVREAFDLYREALERNFLTENGHLSGFTYKNIVRLAANLGETDWAASFLELQKSMLHPRERDNAYRYNRAYLHFQQGEYAHVLRLLQTVEFDDRLNNLDARRMLLRSYFELGEYQALDSLLDSFNTYIRRQRDLNYHRENYVNLIRFTRKLLEIKHLDKKRIINLRKEIESTAQVAEKKWLLSKINAL